MTGSYQKEWDEIFALNTLVVLIWTLIYPGQHCNSQTAFYDRIPRLEYILDYKRNFYSFRPSSVRPKMSLFFNFSTPFHFYTYLSGSIQVYGRVKSWFYYDITCSLDARAQWETQEGNFFWLALNPWRSEAKVPEMHLFRSKLAHFMSFPSKRWNRYFFFLSFFGALRASVPTYGLFVMYGHIFIIEPKFPYLVIEHVFPFTYKNGSSEKQTKPTNHACMR